MNLTLYLAIDCIDLKLAAALESCGPLAVALLSSRTRNRALGVFVAEAGVIGSTT